MKLHRFLLGASMLVGPPAHAQDACQSGFVWREAYAGDRVCVTPETRNQAADDNRQAASRTEPGGGATCRSGYVWRVARPEDLVCVTPETRAQTAADNRAASARRMDAVAAAGGPITASAEQRDEIEQAFGPGSTLFVIRGDPVSVDEQRRRGLVTINGCSGMLLNNQWAITAGHCFASGLPRIANVNLAGVIQTSSHVYSFGNELVSAGVENGRGMDLTLVRVPTPFTVNGLASGFRNRIYRGEARLALRIVHVFGQGVNQINPAAGGGVWREGFMRITSESAHPTEPRVTAVTLLSPQQLCAFGDSGGPMLLGEPDDDQIAAIVETGDLSCPTQPCTPANTTAIRDCRGPKLVNHVDTIDAIIRTVWDVSRTVQVFDVTGSEWLSMRLAGGELNLDRQPWAAMARVANEMCFNRGFLAGRFNGHQLIGDELFGVACAGPGATWRDVLYTEIGALRWRFTDVNGENWAQVGRAAAEVCARDNAQNVGGQFNGHTLTDRAGLICYSQDVKWFDALAAELAATGWPITDINNTLWAHAARAAHEFCRTKYYRTGFMNGHQLNGRYGVVCQSYDRGLSPYEEIPRRRQIPTS